ncbi:MAG: hypothetical protein E7477_07540 [Ruminococcaceae bacterium]|nr:hypothetical protein [Oscillospiraceae bacterium]
MYKSKPTKQQLEWADMELGVLIHYCMEIYNPEFRGYKTAAVRTELPPSIMNPTKLDTDQWIAAAHAMGAKYAVLVANHCTGFSLWQTKVNDYSCASMAWKDGKGDILADFIKSCEKYGLTPGIYYSTGCNGYYDIDDSRAMDYKSDFYREYVKNVEAQVKELWSEYGELFEIWFDGGVIPVEKGGPNLVPILQKYQPNAICFQGPKEYAHNVRWVGNEDGLAPENCWATTNNGEAAYDGTFDCEAAGVGDPNGKYWWPAETDMPNRTHRAFGGGWAWRAGEEKEIFTPEQLLDCYIRSVGRNSNLLMGMAISVDGDFQDTKQFEEFGKLIKETFGKPIVSVDGEKDHLTVDSVSLAVSKPTEINYISIMEDISDGQNIRQFDIFLDGELFYSGECIGHKRIIPVKGKKASQVLLKINKYVDMPTIRKFEIF